MASPARTSHWTAVRLAAGPLLGLAAGLAMSAGVSDPVALTAGVAVWMAVWWLTEAVPLAVTALLPLVMFPLLGVLRATDVAPLYMNDVVFLFIGGFLVALAMEKWELHRRIALRVIMLIGGGMRRMLLGFMAATAFLSMWTSNTATAMMMVPIVSAVLGHYDRIVDEKAARRLSVGLLLGVAYSASIGGLATLVGSPPNLVFARIFAIQFPDAPPVTFARWMFFALPLSLAMLAGAWLLLSLLFVPRAKSTDDARLMFRTALHGLGPMQREEKTVLAAFAALVALWLTRETLNLGAIALPGWSTLLPEPGYVGDGTVAIALATVLFVLPARAAGRRIMDWDTARQLPWGIVLLFGGGFALAGAIATSGLDDWIGAQMSGLAVLPPALTTAGVCSIMTFVTELTSNTATTQMALPILAATAVGIGRNPYFLMVPATLAASCAFMMPVATPPNAIVFGTGRVRIADMARTGLLLNVLGVVLITLWMHLAGPAMFGEPDVLPSWSVTETPVKP